jgi:hypothetical protein
MSKQPEEKFNDYPWDVIVKGVEEQIAKGRQIFQKWSCDHCGSRQGMPVPNVLYLTGECEECGKTTNIKARGCNYMMVAQGDAAMSFLDEVAAMKGKK